MFTIEPPPRRTMSGIACLQHRNVPRTLTANTCSHTSSGVSGAVVVEPTPAMLASTVGGPSSCAHVSNLAVPACSSQTSTSAGTTWFSAIAAVLRAAAALMSAASTCAPLRANSRAVARPIPDPAPVTTVTWLRDTVTAGLDHAVGAKCLPDRHPLCELLADEVLAGDLLLGAGDRLLGDLGRDHDDSVEVGEHQVVGLHGNATALDRSLHLIDVDAPQRVARRDAREKGRKL